MNTGSLCVLMPRNRQLTRCRTLKFIAQLARISTARTIISCIIKFERNVIFREYGFAKQDSLVIINCRRYKYVSILQIQISNICFISLGMHFVTIISRSYTLMKIYIFAYFVHKQTIFNIYFIISSVEFVNGIFLVNLTADRWK